MNSVHFVRVQSYILKLNIINFKRFIFFLLNFNFRHLYIVGIFLLKRNLKDIPLRLSILRHWISYRMLNLMSGRKPDIRSIPIQNYLDSILEVAEYLGERQGAHFVVQPLTVTLYYNSINKYKYIYIYRYIFL